MDAEAHVSEAAVCSLAAVAALPLAEGRETLLAPLIQTWLSSANELSRKMSEPEHWMLAPIVVVTHPGR